MAFRHEFINQKPNRQMYDNRLFNSVLPTPISKHYKYRIDRV